LTVIENKKPNGRIYLSIVESYRGLETKKVRQRNVRNLGYLDELEREYDDPVAYFKDVTRKMTEEAKNEEETLLTFNFKAYKLRNRRIRTVSTVAWEIGR
jgi:hypothetical protein